MVVSDFRSKESEGTLVHLLRRNFFKAIHTFLNIAEQFIWTVFQAKGIFLSLIYSSQYASVSCFHFSFYIRCPACVSSIALSLPFWGIWTAVSDCVYYRGCDPYILFNTWPSQPKWWPEQTLWSAVIWLCRGVGKCVWLWRNTAGSHKCKTAFYRIYIIFFPNTVIWQHGLDTQTNHSIISGNNYRLTVMFWFMCKFTLFALYYYLPS